MNLFKAIYCNQYFELREKGKENAAQKNGSVLASIALMLFFISLAFILMIVFPDFDHAFERFFRDIFGRSAGKIAAKIVVVILFASSFLIIKLTLGRDSSYAKIINDFEALSAKEQRSVSKKGLIFFISSIVLVIVSLVLFLSIRA